MDSRESGLRFGLVIKNSLVQHFVVMVLSEMEPWQYRPGYDPVPQARVVVLATGEGAGRLTVGCVTTISGKVGSDYGDWWVA